MCLPCAAPQIKCEICKAMMPIDSMEVSGAQYQCVDAATCFRNATNLGKRKRK